MKTGAPRAVRVATRSASRLRLAGGHRRGGRGPSPNYSRGPLWPRPPRRCYTLGGVVYSCLSRSGAREAGDPEEMVYRIPKESEQESTGNFLSKGGAL